MRASLHIRLTIAAALLIGAALTIPSITEAASKNYDLGDRFAAFELSATTGEKRIVTLESPSIVVLWATWSPKSLVALKEILHGAPQGGIRWQILPINLDAADLSAADTARVNAAGRAAGWNGPVWHDRGLRIYSTWGVTALPTVVFTALGGRIDELEHDWNSSIRDRLFGQYFGAFTDSFPGMQMPPSTESCRALTQEARRLWRVGYPQAAVQKLQGLADSCADLPNDAGRLASWMWKTGDTMRVSVGIDELLTQVEPGAWPLCARANLAQRRGDCILAADFARAALAHDSVFAPAWIQLAESALRCGEAGDAANAYERANQLNRLDPRVPAIGARLANQRGDDREAARLMRVAVESRLNLSRQ